MSRLRALVPAALLCLSLLLPASAQDQKNRSKLAITDITQADEDFAWQGEYVGMLRTGGGNSQWRPTGLQVAALGDGEFRAIEYPGGLPGAGWNRVERIELAGRREGGVLRLEGWPLVIEIDPPIATVRTTAGETLGRLHQTHRVSYTMGYRPPPGGKVLFDGTSTEHFKNGRITPEGYLDIGADFKDTYRDYNLHLEFQLPYMPYARGQGRANSGVYLQSRYEVQILDSFALEGVENECGALYRYKRPDVNMCLPPLSWQTFDVQFTSPRFDEQGNKVQNARLTVWHNGVLIHNDFEIERKTGNCKPETPELFPIRLQDHGNPVRFRNIWIRENNVPPSAPPLAAASVPVANPGALYSPGTGWPIQTTIPSWHAVTVPAITGNVPAWYQGASVYGAYWPY